MLCSVALIIGLVIGNTLYRLSKIPYTAKLSRGETFTVFTVFQPIAKVFPLNHLPCTVHNGMDLMSRENFPVNGVLCTTAKVFPFESFAVYGTLYRLVFRISDKI